MEFEQLRQLDAIVREGTMSAAARALHISQPALSRSVQRLETDLGTSLFSRAGRGVTLNDAGRAAVDWARQILRDERLMRDAIDAAARRARALRVGTVAPAPLWRLTSLMVEAFPRETLTSETVEESEVIRGVLDGTFDLGIVCERPTSSLLRSHELMRESLSVTLPPNHPLASRASVPLAELDGSTFLILTGIGFWRGLVERALPHATFIEQDDRMVFAQLARTTPHCTFVTDAPYMENDPVPGRASVPLEDAEARVTFYLVARSGATGLASRLFDWVA
ncbi:LysR family transcriptional regulator [Olsenella uli]|uniref:LysR family transcriptional regulator n=1 Tax=Olsenella uli TaxID=133926 RepID=UPI0019577DA9|nr:LysR family transcriptional regulator [Olsenella uli]MBM6815875.1 LysR family transcriptional regulator [Olsenella uli]